MYSEKQCTFQIVGSSGPQWFLLCRSSKCNTPWGLWWCSRVLNNIPREHPRRDKTILWLVMLVFTYLLASDPQKSSCRWHDYLRRWNLDPLQSFHAMLNNWRHKGSLGQKYLHILINCAFTLALITYMNAPLQQNGNVKWSQSNQTANWSLLNFTYLEVAHSTGHVDVTKSSNMGHLANCVYCF